ALEVTRVDTGETLLRRYAPPGTPVRVQAYHSVEGGFITDLFRAEEDGALVLTATRFSAHGAGLPSMRGPGEAWTNGPDAFNLSGRRRTVRRILLRVGEKNGRPLRIGGGGGKGGPRAAPALRPGLYEIGIRSRSPLRWALP
ncbi:MAG: DUF1850 domain-containing protein, partial [Nitrospinota bacterium]